MKHAMSVLFALASVSAVGCGQAASHAPSPPQNASAAKVDVKILDYDGIQALIKSHQGKVVVVDCWSTT